jgi:hypothetical protein
VSIRAGLILLRGASKKRERKRMEGLFLNLIMAEWPDTLSSSQCIAIRPFFHLSSRLSK